MSKLKIKFPKENQKSPPDVGSSKTSSRSISTKRRDEIINDCTEKEKLITLFLLHILRETHNPTTQKEIRQQTLIWKTAKGSFSYSFNLSYYFFSSFSFYQIYYRKAQMHARSNEAGNGLERSRDTNLSFLVWKYFTSLLFQS